MGIPAPAIPTTTALSPSRRVYTETQVYTASALLDVLFLIAGERRTGSLTINFASGKPDGTAEWKQRFDAHVDTR